MNPFVNPSKRGVELPGGCKDLNDVLTKLGFGQEELPQFAKGGVEQIRYYVQHLYEEAFSRKVLIVVHIDRQACFIVGRMESPFEFIFSMNRSDDLTKEAIAEIFGEAAFNPDAVPERNLQTVRAPLAECWEDAAQVIIDFLFRAYGISAKTEFTFVFQDRRILHHVY